MKSGLRQGARAAAAPVQSQGSPVPMGSSLSPLPGSSAGANNDLALIRAFKSNGTAFANVTLIARSVAAQQWNLFRSPGPGNRFTTSDRGSDQRKQVMTHAALNCLNSPASITVETPRGPRRIQAFSRQALFMLSQIYLEACGKSYWVVDTADDASPVPLGLWPVRPDRIVPVPNRDRYLAGYIYRSPDGRETVPLRPDEVIVNRYPDPEDPYGGCGPLQAVLADIQSANYAAEWNKNYFINSAEPGGVIELPTNLTDGEFDTFTNRWRETHRGVARAHRIAILEAGAKWAQNSHSARDMDFVNLRKDSRDVIRESLAMHKVMTGVSDDVNRANAQTGAEVFSSTIVAPRLDQWRDDVINPQFLPLFGATADGNEFDYSYPVAANREQDNAELLAKANAAGTLVRAGYDQHDALKVVGLPDMGVAEQPTQSPALPPGWMPAQPGAGPDGPAAWGRPQAKKDAAAKVYEQVSQDYPPAAMAWMHHASWTGPVNVPLGHIQPMMQWMDGADPDHVQDFVRQRQAGKKLKPVLLVKTPGSPLLLLVDGHHRYLAEAELGEPVRAWIGAVDSDHGDWEVMHDFQLEPSAGGGAGRGDGDAQARRREMAVWNSLAGAGR